MKKIKKINSKMAQSVTAFACPCVGSCQTCVSCGCSGSTYHSQTAFSSAKASISLLEMHGTQTSNY